MLGAVDVWFVGVVIATLVFARVLQDRESCSEFIARSPFQRDKAEAVTGPRVAPLVGGGVRTECGELARHRSGRGGARPAQQTWEELDKCGANGQHFYGPCRLVGDFAQVHHDATMLCFRSLDKTGHYEVACFA